MLIPTLFVVLEAATRVTVLLLPSSVPVAILRVLLKHHRAMIHNTYRSVLEMFLALWTFRVNVHVGCEWMG